MAKAEKNHFIIDFITFDHRNFPEKSEGIQMAETYRAGWHTCRMDCPWMHMQCVPGKQKEKKHLNLLHC
jgi:hypothetical protein